jgi:hypothetical protein
LIVPFPAGGIADLSARALKPSLDKALGQPVTIVNRPGASGAIGAAAVANATADGYTAQATGLGSQAADRECASLRLRWQGGATAVFSAGDYPDSDPASCWRR